MKSVSNDSPRPGARAARPGPGRSPAIDRDDLGQTVQLLLQRGLVGLGVRQHVGDVPDLGVHAGGGDDQLAAAAGDRGVHVGHAGPVAERDVVTRHRVDRLADRQALAGERGLLDLERRGQADPAVGRHPVAGLDQHDVAGHEVLGVDLDRLAVASYPSDRLHHLRESLDALLGLRLLTQPDHGVEDASARPARWSCPHSPVTSWLISGRRQQHDLHEVRGTDAGTPRTRTPSWQPPDGWRRGSGAGCGLHLAETHRQVDAQHRGDFARLDSRGGNVCAEVCLGHCASRLANSMRPR